MFVHTETAGDFTLLVEPHSYSGHGIVEGTFRWTVFYTGNEYRPRAAFGTTSKGNGFDDAVAKGKTALAELVAK